MGLSPKIGMWISRFGSVFAAQNGHSLTEIRGILEGNLASVLVLFLKEPECRWSQLDKCSKFHELMTHSL